MDKPSSITVTLLGLAALVCLPLLMFLEWQRERKPKVALKDKLMRDLIFGSQGQRESIETLRTR